MSGYHPFSPDGRKIAPRCAECGAGPDNPVHHNAQQFHRHAYVRPPVGATTPGCGLCGRPALDPLHNRVITSQAEPAVKVQTVTRYWPEPRPIGEIDKQRVILGYIETTNGCGWYRCEWDENRNYKFPKPFWSIPCLQQSLGVLWVRAHQPKLFIDMPPEPGKVPA